MKAGVNLGQLLLRGGEADAEPVSLAEPAFALCFGDAGGEVVTDVDQALPLGGIDAKEWTANATVFVDAAGPVGASAVAEGEAATLEVAEELVRFRVAGVPVFLAGSQAAAAGDEGPVAVDGLLGVDGFVAHRGVDVFVSQ